MKNTIHMVRNLRIWTDRQGQDLTESALLAGFVTLAAGAIIPGAANYISAVLSKIWSMLPWAVSNGSLK